IVPESLPALLAVAEPGWTTLCSGEVREDAPLDEAVIVVAHTGTLGGSVTGRGAQALSGARVAARLDAETLAAVLKGRDGALQGKWNATTAADGKFVLDSVPGLPRVHLITSHPGWRTDERDVDASKPSEIAVVLEREDPTGPTLDGTVVHADGSPASGALVSLGSARVRTDAQGAFHLMCAWFDATTPLVACARGFQPAVLPAYGARIDPNAQTLAPETIVLPGPELSIEGRVVGTNGAPYKGWRVVLEDGTLLDPSGSSHELAEVAVGGRAETRTGSGGVFKITGLASRSYTLLATGHHRLSRAEIGMRSDPIPAGSRGVVLLAPDGNSGEPIRGRIVNLAGAPLSGILLGLGRPVPDSSPVRFAWQGRFRTVSDSDGRFEILNAPAALAFLVANGEVILPTRLTLAPGAPRSNLELRAPSRREFSFDARAASPRPDRLRALTIAGAPARIWTLDSACPLPAWSTPLSGGSSGPLAVGEDAHELAIYRGCIELGRAAIPSETARISWP
ncbi:MAG TPA: carboxypeptidase-like regulatory domain-containing protein, partial [Thermoanaerobaculia bacterium]|nr:carboxypeptidase-like regulatory domain-containing protein [Thermoanaerobaculia bacterium]